MRVRWQTPLLLTFFIVSTAWSAASFALLRRGGETAISLGAAVLFPSTLLAFVRPVPLPSWAAKPLVMSEAHVRLSVWLCAATALFHSSALVGMSTGTRDVRASPTESHGSSADGRSQGHSDVSPTELVGPSLHL